ncbi:energy-coupling factor ABC transporter permease [Azonexus sp. R2A61]|uniref:energy-coupling factor ABC transporter permease n=1 Tax=Azonexus sp. R2A61 TaxID=2744443 RepID=UPI001F336DF4
MNLTDNLLGEAWYWVAWAIWIPCFAFSVWAAPWGRLKVSEQSNLWLGMIVLLTLVWSLKAGVKPGLTLHLLGANLFTLAFGPHLAFVGLCLVLLGVTLNGAAGHFAYALNALLLAGCGVLLSHFLFRIFSSFLPRHFFVYVFINSFISSAIVVVLIGVVSTALLSAAQVYEISYLFDEYLPYFLLLAFSEAWLSGMLMTLFVIYRPQWVSSFEDSRYLSGK